jgi:hypothetical protein
MKAATAVLALVAFLVGAACGFTLPRLLAQPAPVAHVETTGKRPTGDLAVIQAEVERLKQIVPDQAHAMQDVGYHFSNLWFAGQHEHWDLANFYWSETRSHLRWAVRIIPKRKDSAGREVDLEAILQSVENSPLKQLQDAIAAKDKAGFEKAYRFTLEGCYTCHKASDKPFLRPQIPTQPDTHTINFDPKATWPQ